MHASHQCRRGFTLVELLVVIGIVALLISILLPALNKARLAANVTSCLSNMRQLGMAMHMYANDNRGFVPGNYGAMATSPNTYTWPTYSAVAQVNSTTYARCGLGHLYPYLKSPKAFFDPTGEYHPDMVSARMVYSSVIDQKWRATMDNPSEVLRTGYVYRSGNYDRDKNFTGLGDLSFKMNENAKRGRIMAMDFYYDTWPGPIKPHTDRVNVVFFAGHALTLQDKKDKLWRTAIDAGYGKFLQAEQMAR